MQYELVRAMETLKKQEALLKGLEIPMASRHRRTSSVAFRTHAQLSRILSTLTFYEGKITAARSSSATSALRVVAKELEKDGLHGGQDQPLEELPYVEFPFLVAFNTDALTIENIPPMCLDLFGLRALTVWR